MNDVSAVHTVVMFLYGFVVQCLRIICLQKNYIVVIEGSVSQVTMGRVPMLLWRRRLQEWGLGGPNSAMPEAMRDINKSTVGLEDLMWAY
jgi:hypothetical protein